MDKIIMNNMAFFGYHGVLTEENTLGQKFFVDVVLELELSLAGHSDNVEDTVSYADVYEQVRYEVESEKHKLLEALSENIAQKILKTHDKIKAVDVTIRKPEAPVAGIFDYFGVQIRRERHV